MFLLLKTVLVLWSIMLVLVCMLLLQGCVLVAGYNYATHDVECEAIESDYQREVRTWEYFHSHCLAYIEHQQQEAQAVVEKYHPPDRRIRTP